MPNYENACKNVAMKGTSVIFDTVVSLDRLFPK